MTPLSPSDDDIPSWLKEYYAMDPYLRSEYLLATGTTKAMITECERRRHAARERQRSKATASSQAEAGSSKEGGVSSEREPVVVAVRTSKAMLRFEFRVDADAVGSSGRSWRYRYAPPSRGAAATGPGRHRSGGPRPSRFRGRPGVSLISIVIRLPEN
jgi:hypothetical protein